MEEIKQQARIFLHLKCHIRPNIWFLIWAVEAINFFGHYHSVVCECDPTQRPWKCNSLHMPRHSIESYYAEFFHLSRSLEIYFRKAWLRRNGWLRVRLVGRKHSKCKIILRLSKLMFWDVFQKGKLEAQLCFVNGFFPGDEQSVAKAGLWNQAIEILRCSRPRVFIRVTYSTTLFAMPLLTTKLFLHTTGWFSHCIQEWKYSLNSAAIALTSDRGW